MAGDDDQEAGADDRADEALRLPRMPRAQIVIGDPLQYLGPVRPQDIRDAQTHRFFMQTRIGAIIAGVVSLSVIALVALVMILAVQGRTVEYIKGVVESLQPYILPAFGVLVGYGLGRKPE